MSGTTAMKERTGRLRRAALLACTVVLLLALGAVPAQSEDFLISAWWPGGFSASDTCFTSNDVDSLNELGINMLLATPILNQATYPQDIQDFEVHIMTTLPDSIGFLVYFQPNGMHKWRKMENYAEETVLPADSSAQKLAECVDSLVTKWGCAPYSSSFGGYSIWHEDYESGCSYSTVSNEVDSIRGEDTTRRIEAGRLSRERPLARLQTAKCKVRNAKGKEWSGSLQAMR